jgi:hypothetical protein
VLRASGTIRTGVPLRSRIWAWAKQQHRIGPSGRDLFEQALAKPGVVERVATDRFGAGRKKESEIHHGAELPEVTTVVGRETGSCDDAIHSQCTKVGIHPSVARDHVAIEEEDEIPLSGCGCLHLRDVVVEADRIDHVDPRIGLFEQVKDRCVAGGLDQYHLGVPILVRHTHGVVERER